MPSGRGVSSFSALPLRLRVHADEAPGRFHEILERMAKSTTNSSANNSHLTALITPGLLVQRRDVSRTIQFTFVKHLLSVSRNYARILSCT